MKGKEFDRDEEIKKKKIRSRHTRDQTEHIWKNKTENTKKKQETKEKLYLASIEKMMRGGGNEKGQAELFHDGQLDAPQTLRSDELVERRCSFDVQPALKHVQIGLIVISVN